MTAPLTIEYLQATNEARSKFWDPEQKLNGLFFATELAGELGEACNIVKKLERERLGIRGSRATMHQLAEELADVLICVCLLASAYGIDLETSTRNKFNATSTKLNLPVTI